MYSLLASCIRFFSCLADHLHWSMSTSSARSTNNIAWFSTPAPCAAPTTCTAPHRSGTPPGPNGRTDQAVNAFACGGSPHRVCCRLRRPPIGAGLAWLCSNGQTKPDKSILLNVGERELFYSYQWNHRFARSEKATENGCLSPPCAAVSAETQLHD